MADVIVTGEQVNEISMLDAIQASREGFKELALGNFEMPTRTVLGGGKFLVMSVHHVPSGSAAVKTVSINFESRTPAIVGTVTWSDLMRTDHVIADASAVTALRTGAVTGVATDLLAPAAASTCAMIGAGGQAVTQVRAVHAVRGLRELVIVDTDQSRAEALATRLGPEMPDCAISTADKVTEAVRGRQIVCCATTATQPLFSLEDLEPDVHVNAVGAFRPEMRELPDDLLADATVVVDQVEAACEESGEIIGALASRAIQLSELTELGTALSERPTTPGRTVFKSVGVAMQDWTIAQLLAQRFLSRS